MSGEPRRVVLIVEDEPDMARGLADVMRFEGMTPLVAATGEEGVALAGARRPDVIVLDLMLPDIDGYEVCARVRASDQRVPILMLTARAQEVDKVRGLEVGADDYVTKPFSPRELVARIRALLRRLERAGGPAAEVIAVGDAEVDLRRLEVRRGERVQEISRHEAAILRLLHERAGEPVSRDEILDRAWGVDATPSSRTVDNFIVRLRRKLEPDPKRPRHIVTVYGCGYKLLP